ncbi:hypothetical protein BJ165DRAFT_1528239 [Panaeolus papilionaceus]|nr:hypothetical protein BJ165DRAFT_1528239 [Panaeolus papilionaceus]
MFNLIRRISYGVIPRPDRPWEEDPTSNAPRTQRKRRLSSTERDADGDDDKLNQKKLRTDSETPSVADTSAAGTSVSVPPPQNETLEVKEVTQGVEEVDLEDKQEEGLSDDQPAPESVPLPEDTSGELDDPADDENASSAASSRQHSAEPQQDGSDVTTSKAIVVDQDEEAPSAAVHDATLSEKSKTGKQESVHSAEVESPTVDLSHHDTTTTKD